LPFPIIFPFFMTTALVARQPQSIPAVIKSQISLPVHDRFHAGAHTRMAGPVFAPQGTGYFCLDNGVKLRGYMEAEKRPGSALTGCLNRLREYHNTALS
jgi:hypothetical protein